MRQERVILIDDLTGEEVPGTATAELSLDGELCEVDLSPANRTRLDEILAPYIAAARVKHSPR